MDFFSVVMHFFSCHFCPPRTSIIFDSNLRKFESHIVCRVLYFACAEYRRPRHHRRRQIMHLLFILLAQELT